MKKIIYLIAVIMLSNIMVFGVCAKSNPPATSGVCGENISWTLKDNGQLVISGTGNMENYTYAFATPWEYHRARGLITSVVIGEGVTSIGDYAFYNIYSATTIKLPQTIESIGKKSFVGCDKLTAIDLPSNLMSVGADAFTGCDKLDNVIIPDSVTDLGEAAFSNCINLTKITLSNNISTINDSTFYGCSNLKSIVIPKNVTHIDDYAFYGCENMTKVVLNEGVSKIDYCAFRNCSNLKEIYIPKSLLKIGQDAFDSCDSLSRVYYSGSKKAWGKIEISSFNDDLEDAVVICDYVSEKAETKYELKISGQTTLNTKENISLIAECHEHQEYASFIITDNITWSCSNSNIVKLVPQGNIVKITGLKGGKVTVFAKHTPSGAESSIVIEVKDNKKYVVELFEHYEMLVDEHVVIDYVVKNGDSIVPPSEANISFELIGSNVKNIARIVTSNNNGYLEIKGIDAGKCTLVAKVDGVETDRAEINVYYRNPKVFVNNKEVIFADQKAIIDNGRTLVPARGVFEALGAEVMWNGDEQSVTVKYRKDIVILKIGNSTILVNGHEKKIDVPAKLLNNRTMIPVRAVAEAFLCDVKWDGENYIVWIESPYKYRIVLQDIPEGNVKEKIDMSIAEWRPLHGLTQAMLQTGDLDENNIQTIGSAFEFINNWLGNMYEVTRLNVTVGNDDTVAIKYGTPIESGYSGKKVTLDTILVDKYYNLTPSIIFTANSREDELIRGWFDLSGEGTYSMELDFGKVYVGDAGYYLSIENGEVYQIPIIQEDTTMNVYYKEKGENAQFLFDAADILRNTKIKLSDEEATKVINRLNEYDIKF